jgi:hypothetical protein
MLPRLAAVPLIHRLVADARLAVMLAKSLVELDNSTLAQHALALVARLFRCGQISYHGDFINLATGVTTVLRIDPEYWKRIQWANKHNAPQLADRRRFSDTRANKGRVARPDRRA